MEPNQDKPHHWQQSDGALSFVIGLGSTVFLWGWLKTWPAAAEGNPDAIELMLFSFCAAALAVTMIAAWQKKASWLLIGGIVWLGLSCFFVALLPEASRAESMAFMIRAALLSVCVWVCGAYYVFKKN